MNRLTFCAVVTSAVVLSFTAPAIAQTYELPLRGDDLNAGERFRTRNHGSGNQTEGKDIGARRRVSGSSWSKLKADGRSDELTHWIAYGKPFYAMADGTVIACWRNAPDNPPGIILPPVNEGLIPGGGNHLWIKQTDGIFVLYAHAKPGSIPSKLCPHNDVLLKDSTQVGSNPAVRKWAKVSINNARIRAGEFLGRIGNSGQSDAPHLHVHMEKNGDPVQMRFRRGMTVSFADESANVGGPWRKLDGGAMPNSDILLWPPRPVGNWTFNGTRGSQFQALFDHMTDSGMMPELISCQSDGDTYRSTWVPARGQWVAKHKMSPVEAQMKNAELVAQGFRRYSNSSCGSVKTAVWRK